MAAFELVPDSCIYLVPGIRYRYEIFGSRHEASPIVVRCLHLAGPCHGPYHTRTCEKSPRGIAAVWAEQSRAMAKSCPFLVDSSSSVQTPLQVYTGTREKVVPVHLSGKTKQNEKNEWKK